MDSSIKGQKRLLEDDGCMRTIKKSRSNNQTSSRYSQGTPKRIADSLQNRAAKSPVPTTPKKDGSCSQPLAQTLSGSAVKASGFSGQTPLRLKQTTTKLPSSYALLVKIFGELQKVYLLYKGRQQQCTFQNAKRPVEESCGRQFTIKHLLQLKEAFPDAIQLSSSFASRAQAMGSASKPEAQLSIEMPLLAAPNKLGSLQDLRQQLADRLFERVKEHYKQQLGSKFAVPEDMASWDPSFSLDSVPEVAEAELPVAAISASPALGSPRLQSPATPATTAPRPTPLSSARRPPTGPRTARAMAKRLSFGAPGAAAVGLPSAEVESGGRGADFGMGLDDGRSGVAVEGDLAKQMRRQSMDGTLPVSLQALQAVRRTSEEKAAMFNKEAIAARQQATAQVLLPKTFDSVRAVFGAKGPSVLSRHQVVHKLMGAKAGGVQQAELEGQIDLLADSLPEYLNRQVRPGQGPVLRINRSLDTKSLRAKLVDLAGSVS